MHVRLQICVGFPEKLIRGKKLRDEWGNDERDCNPQGRRSNGDASKQGTSISNRCGFVPTPVPRKQEREQRKSRQGVMRQLRANQRKDNKNDPDACQKISVDHFPAVAGGAEPGLFISPQSADQPRQFDRPGKKTDEDCHKVER